MSTASGSSHPPGLPPSEIPGHLIVIGSGVTGVEFTHMFRSLGSDVTLIVSASRCFPGRTGGRRALEAEFLSPKACAVRVPGRRHRVDGQALMVLACGCSATRPASPPAPTPCWRSGRFNSDGLGLDAAGVTADSGGYVPLTHPLQSNVPHIYVAGDLSGKLPLSSVAAMQGARSRARHGATHPPAPHLDYEKRRRHLTEPEIADVGWPKPSVREGRKLRSPRVRFRNAKASSR